MKLKLARIFLRIEQRYYNLSSRPRHVVGWLIVFSCLLMLFLLGYGVYRGGETLYYGVVTAYHWLRQPSSVDGHSGDADKEWGDGRWRRHHSFPLSDDEKHPTRYCRLYGRDFNDINDTQLVAARQLGIKPLASREALNEVMSDLVELTDTRYYCIDELTSSVPYLVPRAADFLTALGKLMQEYNHTSSRFVITSVLRTQEDVQRLSRHNTNASTNSAHCYATTIDITYNRFDIHGKTWEGALKEDLARALYDLRAKGYCYVKYEYKQACFHITVRP